MSIGPECTKFPAMHVQEGDRITWRTFEFSIAGVTGASKKVQSAISVGFRRRVAEFAARASAAASLALAGKGSRMKPVA